jgi:hypothetical protein
MDLDLEATLLLMMRDVGTEAMSKPQGMQQSRTQIMSRNMLTATTAKPNAPGMQSVPVHFIPHHHDSPCMGINKALKKTISVLLPIVSGVDFKQPIRRRSCKQFEPIACPDIPGANRQTQNL